MLGKPKISAEAGPREIQQYADRSENYMVIYSINWTFMQTKVHTYAANTYGDVNLNAMVSSKRILDFVKDIGLYNSL